MSENYFDWLQRETPTRWWHDSGNPDEIALALQRHAMGVTTNPVLTYRTFNMQPEVQCPPPAFPSAGGPDLPGPGL